LKGQAAKKWVGGQWFLKFLSVGKSMVAAIQDGILLPHLLSTYPYKKRDFQACGVAQRVTKPSNSKEKLYVTEAGTTDHHE